MSEYLLFFWKLYIHNFVAYNYRIDNANYIIFSIYNNLDLLVSGYEEKNDFQ